jgi:hypothetical protein
LLRMISLIRLYTYTSVKYVWNPFYFYLAKTTYSPRIDSHNSIAGWPDTARARQRRAWFLVVHEWRTLLLGVVNFFLIRCPRPSHSGVRESDHLQPAGRPLPP